MKWFNNNQSKLLVLLILSVVCITFSSCDEDVLNVKQPGAEVKDFWQNAEDAIAASNSLYEVESNKTWAGENYSRGWWSYIQVSDDMVTGRERGAPYRSLTPTGNEVITRDMWAYNYKIIKRANDIITNVPNITMDNALKTRIIGEAYFMAAWKYLELAMHYGNKKAGIPIIKPGETNYLQPRSANVQEDYTYIESLLQNAIDRLPFFTTYSQNNYGRAHKNAARAMLAKTYLYHAQYDNSLYAKVAETCNQIIGSDGRALLPTYDDVFKWENNWGSEYIWSITNSFQGTPEGSSIANVMLENGGWGVSNGWGFYHPTLSLYQEFETGDLRRERTILKFGDTFTMLGNVRTYFSANSKTGFQFNKYMRDWENDDWICQECNYTVGRLNVPFIRYAEVLLWKAEALIMQGQNGDNEINLVRQRVGLPAISGATMANLKHERRVELAGELAHRHFDLVRWGDAQATYAKPDMGREHSNKLDPSSSFTIIEVWPARNFNPNIHNVFPIPLQEINASEGLWQQNEGY